MALPAAGAVSTTKTSRTFYKRALPCPPAVSFSSSEGKRLFAEALQAGTMESFFKLIEQFRTQDEPAFCGLASLAMVLNALAIDPRRAWKGPWRWFHEQMLDCCQPLSQVLASGISLDQAACLARCNGAKADLCHHGSFSEESFRHTVQEMCASEQQHMIVSYSRKHLLQTGDGHFSPVGGYHAQQDMVLILDTARFKYPPHWVPLRQLYQAMAHTDPATGKARGFITVRANPCLESVMFTLNRPDRAWQDMKAFMEMTLPAILRPSPRRQLTSSELVSCHDGPNGALAHCATESQGNSLQTRVIGLHSMDQPAVPNDMARSAGATSDALPEGQNTAEPAAVQALLPIVQAVPMHSALQLLALRSASPADCCSSAQAACIPPAAADLFLNELHSTELFKVVGHCLSHTPALIPTPPVGHPQAQEGSVKQPLDAHQSFCPHLDEHERHLHGAQDKSDTEKAPQHHANESSASCPISQHGSTVSLTATAAEMPGASNLVPGTGVGHSICQAAAEAAVDNTAADSSQNQCACEHQQSSINADQELGYSTTASVTEPSLQQGIASNTATLANGRPVRPGLTDSDGMGLRSSGAEVQPVPVTDIICMVLLLVPRAIWDHSDTEVKRCILQLLDMTGHSVVASEAEYLAAQWVELPKLQSLDQASSICCT